MKKFKFLSFLLCLTILMQSVILPVSADETQETVATNPIPDVVQAAAEPAFGTVCVQKGCRTIEGMVPLGGSGQKLDTAQGVFLYEINTGTVVYSFNPDTKLPPGSLAKIVNAAVVMQHCKLEDEVKVTGDIHRRPAGSIHTGLKTDEIVTVEALLHCLLLQSGNDAAIALADHVAGNQQNFTMLMNQWVEDIGCTGTRFGNVHGLDNAECTTTARDMAKIFLAAIENEDLKEILGARSYKMEATNKNEEHSFRTQNYMIDEGVIQDFYDDRVTGGMQSYVQSLGASIVVTAQSKHEDDDPRKLNYVAVVLCAERTFQANGWSPISYGNFNEMTDLIKLGFDSYKVNRIVYDGMAMSSFTVAGGECNAVGEAVVDINSVVPINAHMDNLIMNYSVTGGGLSAPIKKGDKIATVQVEYRGSVMAEAEVFAMGNVERATGNGITIHATASRSDSGGSGFLSAIGTICVIGLGLAAAYLTFNAYMRNRIRARRRKRRAERRRNY